jgi:predicted MFS family arabinose efflux permease
MNISVLLPVFTKNVLFLGESGYGYLMSIVGIGYFIGAMTIASTSKGGPHSVILKIYPYLVGFMLIFIAVTREFWLTGFGLALLGFFYVSFAATSNSTIQYNTVDEYRGRVMSVYSLFNGGVTPIGSFYAGMITDRFGATAGFFGCGAIIVALLGIFRLIKIKHKNPMKENVQSQ